MFLKRTLITYGDTYRLGHHRQGESITPGFEIAWNRRRLARRQHGERAPLVQDAILLERALPEGRPQLKIVCPVASAEVIASQQSVADRLARLGLIPKPIDVSDIVWKWTPGS